MSKYKEDVYEEVEYEKPTVILKKLKEKEKEIMRELEELEGMIK
jgi:type I restriction enzyme M protein